MAQRRVARLLAILGAVCAVVACRPTPVFDLSWIVEPRADATGADAPVTVVIRRGTNGEPVTGARLTLEAHMSHPGMAPVVSDVAEVSTGRYQARLRLTMTGDWTLILSGTLADGQRVTWEHRIGINSAPPAA
jgi:hypothetical protein